MKVYISATYRDLQKHRLAVASVLRRMGHQAVGMEDYVSEGVRPLSRCFADVDRCDVYVGIVAWRYGYIPKAVGSNNLPKGSTLGKTSMTEFEFRLAIEKKKPILMFLLDPEAEWPSSQFDALESEGDQGKAISAWRDEIRQKYLASYFRTPEELAAQVSAAVYRVEIGQQMTLESLRLNEPLSQSFARNGSVVDSTLQQIKDAVAGPQQVEALYINIGEGLDWWMSRLYFLASLAADLTSIQMVIFAGEGDKFIGSLNPLIVKERLPTFFDVFQPYENSVKAGSVAADRQREVDRRAAIWANSIPNETSIGVFVSKPELERWFSPYLISSAIEWDTGVTAALQIQRLLDWPLRFVPVIENGRFSRVVDKRSLTEQIARLFVREQISRAVSTFQ